MDKMKSEMEGNAEINFEIIFVNDGSKDKTLEVHTEISRKR